MKTLSIYQYSSTIFLGVIEELDFEKSYFHIKYEREKLNFSSLCPFIEFQEQYQEVRFLEDSLEMVGMFSDDILTIKKICEIQFIRIDLSKAVPNIIETHKINFPECYL